MFVRSRVEYSWKVCLGILLAFTTTDQLIRTMEQHGTDARCCNCGQTETTRNAMQYCTVGRGFCSAATRIFSVLKLGEYLGRGQYQRGLFERLLLVLSELVFTYNRRSALRRRRRMHIVFPLISRLHGEITRHPEDRLALLGELEFLSKRLCSFVNIAEGRLVGRPVILDADLGDRDYLVFYAYF